MEPKILPTAKLGEPTTVIELTLVTNSGRVVAKAKKKKPIRLLVILVLAHIASPYKDNLYPTNKMSRAQIKNLNQISINIFPQFMLMVPINSLKLPILFFFK